MGKIIALVYDVFMTHFLFELSQFSCHFKNFNITFLQALSLQLFFIYFLVHCSLNKSSACSHKCVKLTLCFAKGFSVYHSIPACNGCHAVFTCAFAALVLRSTCYLSSLRVLEPEHEYEMKGRLLFQPDYSTGI